MPRARAPLDFAGIIALFGPVVDFCRVTGVPEATARAWISRDVIPAKHWDQVINGASEVGLRGVSIDVLMAALRIAEARKLDKLRQQQAAAVVPEVRASAK